MNNQNQKQNRRKGNNNKKKNPVKIGRLLNLVRNETSKRGRAPPRPRRTMRKGIKGMTKLNRMTPNKVPRNLGGKSGFGNKKCITISETEYIQEYTTAAATSGAFYVGSSLPVNPGQASTFPWLSTIAANYQKYKFLALEFFYEPEVTQYAPTGANIGKVVMAAEYNSSLGAPNNKEDMEDIEPNANDMPYEVIKLRLDPKELNPNSDAKFIRIAGLPGGSDIKTYDCANIFVANQGQTASATVLGELHVRYTVMLCDPIILGQLGIPNNYSVSQLIAFANESLTSGIPHNVLFADKTAGDGYNNGVGVVNTTGSIVLPIGNYQIFSLSNFTTTGNSTSFGMVLDKNGSNVTAIVNQIQTPSGAYPFVTLTDTSFVTSNGTDAFTLVVTPYFSTGNVTVNAKMVITAI
jgi:hypothetical protein